MLFNESNYKFMYAALQEAEKALEEDEIPIGALITYKNKIIGKGYNQVVKLNDPTAHAEMIAITAAANFLNSYKLDDCDIYVTAEPCIMCAGAILNSRIKNLFFSVYEPKFGACGSLYNLVEEGKYNHKTKVFSGIYIEESKKLLNEFFRKKRNQKN